MTVEPEAPQQSERNPETDARLAPPTQRRTDKPAPPVPASAFWNGIARAWFVEVNGEAVRLDPQPLAPGVGGVPVSPRIDL